MILFEVYHSMVILKQFPRMVFKNPPVFVGVFLKTPILENQKENP